MPARIMSSVAATAERTRMVPTAPITLPRPRHRSKRCMDAAIVPMRPDGRKMKKRRPKMNEMTMRTTEKDRYHCIKP